MGKVNFHLARFLKTIGLKNYANDVWNIAEKKQKQERWSSSNFENIFIIDQGLLSNKLDPKPEAIENLAIEQIYHRSAQFLDVFGFTTLRSFFEVDKINKINSILNEWHLNSSSKKTIYASPVENSRVIQDILINKSLFDVVSKIMGPFWYFGSDAAANTLRFPLHRDTFFKPPFYKIFIPTQPGVFQVLSGSHYVSDEFSRLAGSYVSDWDKPNNLAHGSSSIYFENTYHGSTIVGYDDSHKNPPLTNISLGPGDVFIFNQNLVHGLLPVNLTTSFVAMSAFPSPESSRKFGLTRQEHLENIIRASASIILIEKDLSASKNLDPREITYPCGAFAEEDLRILTSDSQLKECFGLSRIPQTVWEAAIEKNSHASWEVLRDTL